LLLEPDLRPEHVRALRDALHCRQELRSDIPGYSLYGGQLVLHSVGEYGRRLSEPKQLVNSSFSRHIVALPAFRAESLIMASLSLLAGISACACSVAVSSTLLQSLPSLTAIEI
jgi:hypothetical protein